MSGQAQNARHFRFLDRQPSRDVASFVERLKKRSDVLAIVLFGSGSREELTDKSDLDLLVIRARDSKAQVLRREAIKAGRDSALHLSALVLSQSSLRHEVQRRPSFGSHLIDEGRLVYIAPGTSPEELLEFADPSEDELRQEVREAVELLYTFADIDRFKNAYAPCAAHLYAIGRSIVNAKLLEGGVHEFSWQRAFDKYGDLHPDIRQDIQRIKDLRFTYEYVRGRTMPPPVDTVDRDDVQDAVASIRRVAAS